jgi:hypothetical protein
MFDPVAFHKQFEAFVKALLPDDDARIPVDGIGDVFDQIDAFLDEHHVPQAHRAQLMREVVRPWIKTHVETVSDTPRPEQVNRANEVVYLLRDLPLADQLEVVTFAWVVIADQTRRAALSVPNGFPAERDRQMRELTVMRTSVERSKPDLELERLVHEGSEDELDEYLRRRDQRADGE